jgi:hypothetical protein
METEEIIRVADYAAWTRQPTTHVTELRAVA